MGISGGLEGTEAPGRHCPPPLFHHAGFPEGGKRPRNALTGRGQLCGELGLRHWNLELALRFVLAHPFRELQ